jgi:hypothetical protein
MVPASYHSFFTDTAQVAGTLIGLLFVAISLAPEKLDGHDADFQIKAGIAFAALINGLVIGLTALLPGEHLAITATIRACGGISSAIGLGAISFRHAHLGQRFRALYRVAGLLALFTIQLVNSLQLGSHPHHASLVRRAEMLVPSEKQVSPPAIEIVAEHSFDTGTADAWSVAKAIVSSATS